MLELAQIHNGIIEIQGKSIINLRYVSYIRHYKTNIYIDLTGHSEEGTLSYRFKDEETTIKIYNSIKEYLSKTNLG